MKENDGPEGKKRGHPRDCRGGKKKKTLAHQEKENPDGLAGRGTTSGTKPRRKGTVAPKKGDFRNHRKKKKKTPSACRSRKRERWWGWRE